MKKQFLFKTMLTAGMLASIMNMTSCKDDFSEEQYLKKEYELAEQKSAADQVRALALLAAQAKSQEDLARLQQLIAKETRDEYLDAYKNAGLLVDANFIVLDAVTKKGVENVTVSLMGKEAITSAEGVANFTDIAIGGGDIKLASENYYAATSPAIIAYQTPATSGRGGLPIKRTISATFNMVGKGTLTESSVTVKGKVSLDNDLTNAKTEVPQDITVSVDYAASLIPNSNSNGIQIVSYQLDNPDFQPAVVDATTGEYSIVVPAIDGVKLVLPEIESNVKYIVENDKYTENSELDKFLLETGTAVFKTNEVASNNYQTQEVSTGDLYSYEFSKLKGSGFDLEFKQLFDDLYKEFELSDNYYSHKFTPGTQYKSLPTVTMTANGSDKINSDKVYLNATIKFSDKSKLTITGGDNLAPNYYDIIIKYTDKDGNDQSAYFGNVEYTVDNEFKNINSYTNIIENIHSIKDFILEGVQEENQPKITRAIEEVSIKSIKVKEGATSKGEYTSWPNITFTGGEANLEAKFEFSKDKPSKWEATITNNGSGYEALPSVKYMDDYDVQDLGDSSGMYFTSNLILNTNGTITFKDNMTKVITEVIRPSEISTVVEDKLNDDSGAEVILTFTNYTDKDNDIADLDSRVSYTDNSFYKYMEKPTHQMVKNYEWVKDATTPLEINIVTYWNVMSPDQVEQVKGTGKGYMNPKPQTDVSNPNTISASDAGKTITRDFKYGIGELKK